MATLDNVDYVLHLPQKHARGELDQDQEWCEIESGGKRRRIRFHDYAAIYDVPGLYERLFAEQLECDSPRVVTELLGAELRAARVKPGPLTALDFGAGNGMVGELLADLTIAASSASTCSQRRATPRTGTARTSTRTTTRSTSRGLSPATGATSCATTSTS